MSEEQVDIVDDHDRPIATRSRSEAYARKDTIRIVHVFIFNTNHEMLVQLRSHDVAFAPGHWVTAGSGHVQAGESYEQAGLRELQEEIGITTPLTFKETERYVQPDGMVKFLAVLEGTSDQKRYHHSSEVEQLAFLSLSDIQSLVERGEKMHPEFLFLLQRHYGVT